MARTRSFRGRRKKVGERRTPVRGAINSVRSNWTTDQRGKAGVASMAGVAEDR